MVHIHRCLKGAGKPFINEHINYGYPVNEINPTVERQVRIEGNTWTLYHYGEVVKVIPIDKRVRQI